jgi:DNA-binding transcriptional MerR regulator
MADKIYFKIGEVADMLNVTPTQLRYWEQEFSFLKPMKNSKQTRYYNKKDIAHIRIIAHLLKEKGMTVKGAKDYLKKHSDEEALSRLEVIATLKQTRELLVNINQIIGSR